MTVLLDNKNIMPLHGSEKPNICTFCAKPEARWLVRLEGKSEPWCAQCFLGETGWGKTNSNGISELIVKVEEKLNRQMRDTEGRLSPDDADRILSSIVFVSAYKNKRK
jgi:hypothetical protein